MTRSPPNGTVSAAVGILYVDEHLAVWSKPSGELVHRGWARGEPTSMTRLRDELGRWVYPVHRLDRGTSGALLMALDSDMARALGELFAAGDVDKSYLALTRGCLLYTSPSPRDS